MYAVNLAEWLAYKDDIGLQIILMPIANRDVDAVVMCQEDHADSMAVILECDEERAAAAVKLIRKRYAKHRLRCYQSKTGESWKRV